MEHDYVELEEILSQPFSDQGECENIIAQAHAWLIKSKGELQQLFSTAPRPIKHTTIQSYVKALETWIQNIEDQILGEEAST